MFDDEEGARISNERGTVWGRENLAEFSDGRPPETLAGKILVTANR